MTSYQSIVSSQVLHGHFYGLPDFCFYSKNLYTYTVEFAYYDAIYTDIPDKMILSHVIDQF